jgi:hypothetical protein
MILRAPLGYCTISSSPGFFAFRGNGHQSDRGDGNHPPRKNRKVRSYFFNGRLSSPLAERVAF